MKIIVLMAILLGVVLPADGASYHPSQKDHMGCPSVWDEARRQWRFQTEEECEVWLEAQKTPAQRSVSDRKDAEREAREAAITYRLILTIKDRRGRTLDIRVLAVFAGKLAWEQCQEAKSSLYTRVIAPSRLECEGG